MARGNGWTVADVGDQAGRIVLVTGANSGIGFETARAFAAAGAHVVMACRNRSKAERARRYVLDENPRGEVSLIDLDLASLTSVRSAAAEFEERFGCLHTLINNAGVMATPKSTTVDGFELQFGINHLGHFALTGLLLPALLRASEPRVVTVSSLAHHRGVLPPEGIPAGRYRPWRAYSASKLANLLFTAELQRRADDARRPLRALAAHPGLARTNLARASTGLVGRLASMVLPLSPIFVQSSALGALPTLRAAADPRASGGEYFGPSGRHEWRGLPVVVGMSAAAADEELASQLWAESERLTGVTFVPLARAVA